MSLITVLDTRPSFAEKLGKALARDLDHEVRFERYTLGKGLTFDAASSVLVFGPGIEPTAAVSLAEKVSSHPAPALVLVAEGADTALLKAAMRAGIRDVVSPKDAPEDLAADVLAAERGAGGSQGPQKRGGRIVTVLGMKGGVGKSVVSTNLAVALAKLGRRTVLVDLDLQFGDAAIMLQLRPERTIFDAMQSFERLDEDMLSGYLVRHPSGLQALLAPVAPEEAETVTGARLARVLTLLRALADVVVIDTPPALNDVVLTCLEESDEVFAVSGLEVPSVKSIRVALQKLEQLGFDPDHMRLVVNRADSKVGLDTHEVRRATRCEIAAEVPSDRIVPSSVNRGVPIVLDKPKSAVAKSLFGLAQDIASRCPVLERTGRSAGVNKGVA